MYTYIFSGQIHPERVNFRAQPTIWRINIPAFRLTGELNVGFDSSKILAHFFSDSDYTKDPYCNLSTLKNQIMEFIRSVVDSYCYVRSYAYDVEITSVQCPELGIARVFDVRGEYTIVKTDEQANLEFTTILKAFTKSNNIFLKDVLADFCRAIKYPAMTASFCYRAIETIRIFCFEESSDTEKDVKKRARMGWEKLRSAYHVEESDFDQIKKFALRNRHGEYPPITGQEREKIMNFTRLIIDKTIQMIK